MEVVRSCIEVDKRMQLRQLSKGSFAGVRKGYLRDSAGRYSVTEDPDQQLPD